MHMIDYGDRFPSTKGVPVRPQNRRWRIVFALLSGFCLVALSVQAQKPSPATVPVSFVVTVEASDGQEVPAVNRADVRAYQGKDRLEITDWVPLQADQAALELYILIDQSANTALATRFNEIRDFLNKQPPTTSVAIGYMQYGTVQVAQPFTKDHEAAGKALHIPIGMVAGGNSPYLSVSDVIKHWPESASRHEIFLITDGIDALQPGITDSYLDGAIEQAQRTGTQVYAIYVSAEGHFGHTLWRINQGQNNLSRLTDETGGEFYYQGFSTPISFAPFLQQFANRLNHQYRLSILAKAESKPSYQHIRLETEVPNADLVAADRVYVPAAK